MEFCSSIYKQTNKQTKRIRKKEKEKEKEQDNEKEQEKEKCSSFGIRTDKRGSVLGPRLSLSFMTGGPLVH